MGYRIEYAVRGRTLLARVSGVTHVHAAAIARDIREEARRAAIKHLLIDVRGLVDRLGNLATLVRAAAQSEAALFRRRSRRARLARRLTRAADATGRRRTS